MATLSSDLRSKLERVVIEARDVAEAGARAALEALAVHHHEPYPHMKPHERKLRNHLRARARQLGDRQDASGRIAMNRLVGECAYEQWHRMLFARFLAENNLLIEPEEKMTISLSEAGELAKDQGQDVWEFASRCAQDMLPQIFRPDDPLLQVSFATEHRIKLERLLGGLPGEVFTASDALGWVYQFWQTKKKKEVNDSEVKIGADEISAVTQLFTEPYMVEFLLHNTLGAWWAGKNLSAEDAQAAESEEELRNKVALPGVGWEYLRFVRGGEDSTSGPWRPAAGTFDGWPKAAKDLKVLDPCCGSGHFLVAALHHLVPIRMAEEGLSAAEAIDAVLRDNLHGLEIDERCCQIAAFALAFAAWTFAGAGGYRELPEMHIACCGVGPQCTAEQWVKLAEESGIPMPRGGREPIRNGLSNLHRLFSQAPTLGSLIDPTELPRDLIAADFDTIQPYLMAIMRAEKADDETRERAVAAATMVKAVELLTNDYYLVVTNVPFKEVKQLVPSLQKHISLHFTNGKVNFATTFLLRISRLLATGGSAAVVTPHEWLFLKTYTPTRNVLLKQTHWNALVDVGEHGFASAQAAGAFTALIIITRQPPTEESSYAGWDITDEKTPERKRGRLLSEPAILVPQLDQTRNPDARIGFSSPSSLPLLSEYAGSFVGLQNGDTPRFVYRFWEFPRQMNGWEFFQLPCDACKPHGGREGMLRWEDGRGTLTSSPTAYVKGREAWGRLGVAVRQTRSLPATLYEGHLYDQSSAALIPKNPDHLAAIWAYCSSRQFHDDVRKLDKKKNVTNATLCKVPFDLDHWQKVAAEQYPGGLPLPESDDPTQWIFHGLPNGAQEGTQLQVAVARLLGYRWPAELDREMRLSKRAMQLVVQCEALLEYSDDDGIVCIPSVRGEEPAAEQLRALLTACGIKPDVDLNDWLRNKFFEEHINVFHHRPFIWHIWDGRKRDGFHALVNYHKLVEGDGNGRRMLESLTYAYLGDWITRQRDGVKQGEGGAEDRLAAALELQKRLEAILAGEPPFDIFVRWKPLHEQPIGWEPDVNDGVRINIRPFLAADLSGGRVGAGILRYKPRIDFAKDRGSEPQEDRDSYPWLWEDSKYLGERVNDRHYSVAEKRLADTGRKGG